MAKRAIEHTFDGDTVPYTSYDHTKTMLGRLIKQNDGTGVDSWAGPWPLAISRPNENPVFTMGLAYSIAWSSTIDWIFTGNTNVAALTRVITVYRYDKSTNELSCRGNLGLTYSATNHTIRGLAVGYHTYSTGNVTISDISPSSVSGSGTAWQTARFAVGARIGFGTTDPTAVTKWYYISAIGSNTAITLSGAAPAVTTAPFVIEELRIYTATTASTTTNGGLFVAKGINFDDFSSTTTPTTIALAVSTDNLKANYWLKDASTVTNTTSCGLTLGAVSDSTQILYVLNGGGSTSSQIFKYDARVALTVASGASTNAFVLKTGTQTTGTLPQQNGCVLCPSTTTGGGGVPCVFFVDTNNVRRVVETDITAASTTFITDTMQDLPHGGTDTFLATTGYQGLHYVESLDMFMITISQTNVAKDYMTQYRAGTTNQYDQNFGVISGQMDQSLASSASHPYLYHNTNATNLYFSCHDSGNGMIYMIRGHLAVATSITATNQMYAVPLGADWMYAAGIDNANQNRLITPELPVTNANKLYRVYVNATRTFGTPPLDVTGEPYRVYARTSGISDDSISWTLLDASGGLSGLTVTSAIQFMIEFKTIGTTGIPAKIHTLVVVYEDNDNTDSHYIPSTEHSDITSNIFAWYFANDFGGSVPALRVQLFNAVSGASLVDDNTNSPTGTFQRSTDNGSSWVSWSAGDRSNDTTYLRYIPASLNDGVSVRALLTQL